MQAAAYQEWLVSGPRHLQTNSAASYVDYLEAVERELFVDLDREWDLNAFRAVRARIAAASWVEGTKKNRIAAVNAYQQFRTEAG